MGVRWGKFTSFIGAVIAAVALLVVEEEGSENGREAEGVLDDAVVI
jgi:hypothetical protein